MYSAALSMPEVPTARPPNSGEAKEEKILAQPRFSGALLRQRRRRRQGQQAQQDSDKAFPNGHKLWLLKEGRKMGVSYCMANGLLLPSSLAYVAGWNQHRPEK